MATYNNQAPTAVNNVGLYGATDESIGAYKQASEYAADARYWALLAESKFGTVDDLIAEVERLFQQGILMRADIEQLKQDFENQDARLMVLVAEANAAASNAQNAVDIVNQKLIEIQAQLDLLLAMKVTVETLPPGSEATGSFNNQTGEIHLGIPEGEKGAAGSVTNLSTAPTGTPEIGDIGFYVDKDDNTVHKTSLESIANLIPSVRSIKVNDGVAETGEVVLTLTKDTVGLGNVLNLPQYSRQEVNNKVDNFIKVYGTKEEADADAANRQVGETVLVWNSVKYDFYEVASNKTLTPSKSEPRIVTVNSRVPDSSGNIDITIPTGNPSLYLGEMVMFPYDPSKNVSYPGVLPADGRLVAKETAGDLGPSLVSGQLPVVSETQWQSGARQYFSWGKLADGVTDADSTNFVSIRLPDWTGGEAIRSPSKANDGGYSGSTFSQTPYIVTVNGKGPNDTSGNVVLSSIDLGAAKSGANSDITELNGLTKPITPEQGGTGATDIGQARIALNVQAFHSGLGSGASAYSHMSSPDYTKELRLDGHGGFRLVDGNTSSTVPFAINSGGTGAETADGARTNLGIDRFVQRVETETQIKPTSASQKRMFCNENGDWGYYDDASNETLALRLGRGGTGATTLEGARFNLGVDLFSKESSRTAMYSANKQYAITVDDTGLWGAGGPSGAVALGVGFGGTGGTTVPVAQRNLQVMESNNTSLQLDYPNLRPGIYYVGDNTKAGGNGKPFNYAQILTISEQDGSAGNWSQMAFPLLVNAAPKLRRRNASPAILSNWYDFLVKGLNATVDANGFYKAASPVVKVKGDGTSEANDFAEGVSVSRVDVGVYKISGTLGFNSDPAWGGISGGFSIPQNSNGLPLLWVDYEVDEAGDILLKTFHRTHEGVPEFASNKIKGVAAGEPIDIPEGRWIDLRVEMPESK